MCKLMFSVMHKYNVWKNRGVRRSSETVPGLQNDIKKRLFVNDLSNGKAGIVTITKDQNGNVMFGVDSDGGTQLIKFYIDGHITAEHKIAGGQWKINRLIEPW